MVPEVRVGPPLATVFAEETVYAQEMQAASRGRGLRGCGRRLYHARVRMQPGSRSQRIKRGAVPFQMTNEPLPPMRGLVPVHNRLGLRRDVVDLKRWLRYVRLYLKILKADVFDRAPSQSLTEELLDYALDIDLRLSLRTTCEAPPCNLDRLREGGLLDLFLSPLPGAAPHFRAWIDACLGACVPVRLQLLPPWDCAADGAEAVRLLVGAGVVVVNLAMGDELLGRAHTVSCDFERLNRFAAALSGAEIEMNMLGVPEANVTPSLRSLYVPQRLPGIDDYTYEPRSLVWALRLYEKRINAARIALLIKSAGEVSRLNKVDNLVYQFLLHKREWILDKVLFWHKLTRFHPRFSGAPRALENRGRARLEDALVPIPEGGLGRRRYIDEVDVARLESVARTQALVREALQVTCSRAPDQELGPETCHAANGHTEPIPGALRWYGAANVEKLSNEFGPLSAPFCVTVTFGGGHAEYIGFAAGRYGRVVCPMQGTSHTLSLFVQAGGQYVLLCDGRTIRPVEFDGPCYVPSRFPDQCRLRLSLWNIDGTIVTQSPQIWLAETAGEVPCRAVKYSVVLVCTRYARRLQAALIALAQQRDFDLGRLEMLVAYVPGLDAAEDVLDSVQAAWPQMNIRRFPFDERQQTAKGLMINETLFAAAGEWVVLLDADIIVPPHFLATLDKVEADCHFIAPDGRKMIDRDTTARILLGQIEPYACWDWLMSGPGEFRYREAQNTPIGYCQAVRRACFESLHYPEYPHFEGADWVFAQELCKAFGAARRLDGVPVLHLDHGASQWYGARHHF